MTRMPRFQWLLLMAFCVGSYSIPAWTAGAETEKFFFLGEVKRSSATGEPMGSQAILVAKVHDPDHSTWTETAILISADGKAEEHIARAVVKGDTFTLTDDAKTIEGSGNLFGPPWKWTYFKATFKSNNGAKIDDENFMADDSVITARKKVTAPDGKVVMYMDMSVKAITPKTYEILRAALLKK